MAVVSDAEFRAALGRQALGRSLTTSERDFASALEAIFHSGDHDLLLGAYGGLHFLNGALDEVKIWDRPLTADEIPNEARR